MAVLVRRLGTVAAVLALASVLISAGSPSQAASARPSLYFVYAMNCTFTIQNDQGQTVSSIPPGNYQVDVRTPLAFGTVPLQDMGINDMTACKGFPQFQLSGPGVDISTTMTAGCSEELTFAETFQAGATYVAQDNNQASVTKTVLTIQSSGTPTAPPSLGVGGGKGTTETGIVGSGLVAVKGTLSATLSARGALTLTNRGKPVSKLAAGKYTFAINDNDPKASFIILGPKSTSKTNLTGVKFVGKKSITVNLKSGRWTYYSALGNIHYIVVTAA